jgi:hypothetical protein
LTGHGAAPRGLPTRALAGAALALVVFSGGFVLYEPAPYELLLLLVIPAWLLSGLPVPRATGPLAVLLIVFVAGGVLSITQAREPEALLLYAGTSVFLAVTAWFFALVVAHEPERHLGIIANAWIAAALFTATLGIAGYFGLTPGGLFVVFHRAAGGFKDPNVFGPFLVFPLVVLTWRALTAPLPRAALNGLAALYLLIAVFLSFSRAAWGLALATAVVMVVLMYLNERRAMARLHYLLAGTAAFIMAALVLAAALSIDAVREIFDWRAHVVHDYDTGPLGRFTRYPIGFQMMMERPLGLGAFEFGLMFGEDEHNIWLKALTTYGWLGFAAFLVLMVWTLLAAFPLLFRTRPWQPLAQAAYLTFLGHLVIANIIDVNHWRHFYLLLGVLWGLIAVEAMARSRLARAPAPAQLPPGYREVVLPGAAQRH